jgi:metal-responsive CopG/Arc/MetJ family transcriptional regulator
MGSTTVVACRLPNERVEVLDGLAKERGVSRSDVVANAVERELTEAGRGADNQNSHDRQGA